MKYDKLISLNGVLQMKGFTKFLIALAAVFVGVIGALAVFDKFSNKNRIKGDYLECDVDNVEDIEEE